MAHIAVAIAEKDIEAIKKFISEAAVDGAEVVEVRVDAMSEPTPENVCELIKESHDAGVKIIVTCRDINEGGYNDIDGELKEHILTGAIGKGADFVDVELVRYRDSLREAVEEAISGCEMSPPTKLIISSHNFDGPFKPGKLEFLYDYILGLAPNAIPKLVYKANHINDCFEAIDLLENKTSPAIALCMGQAGQISRILAGKFGSFLTFACPEGAVPTADGQVSVRALKKLYRWDSVGPSTKIFGIIGSPVGHSMSPTIFNACFESERSDCVYVPLLVEGNCGEFFRFMGNVVDRPWAKFGGFSVTIPHKGHAMEFAADRGGFIEDLAGKIGAVNTIKVGYEAKISAYNTDYEGAIGALCRSMKIDRGRLAGINTAVLGAGGAARAVVAGLTDCKADVTIYNRTESRAQHLAEAFKCKWAGTDSLDKLEARIVINCTSLGMSPNVDASPLPAGAIKKSMVVFDTVYNPLFTKLLNDTKAAGAKRISGLEMFIGQAMAQYEIFTGQKADEKIENIMRSEALKKLGQDYPD